MFCIAVTYILFLIAWCYFLTHSYGMQEQYLFIDSQRRILNGFHSSCMEFRFQLLSILSNLTSLYQPKKLFVSMIWWTQNLSRNLKLNCVKYPLLPFTQVVCFEAFSVFPYETNLNNFLATVPAFTCLYAWVCSIHEFWHTVVLYPSLHPYLHMQVITSLLEVERGNCVGLTWTFHLSLTEFSSK